MENVQKSFLRRESSFRMIFFRQVFRSGFVSSFSFADIELFPNFLMSIFPYDSSISYLPPFSTVFFFPSPPGRYGWRIADPVEANSLSLLCFCQRDLTAISPPYSAPVRVIFTW